MAIGLLGQRFMPQRRSRPDQEVQRVSDPPVDAQVSSRIEWMVDGRKVFVGAAAAILCYQLILPPVVGLADNGDFGKVIGRFDLHGKVYRPGHFIDTVYEFDPERRWVSEF